MEMQMFTVTYSYYGRYQHQKQFSTEGAAKKFFWVVQRRPGVTKVEYTAS
jgi:hypothetical protein